MKRIHITRTLHLLTVALCIFFPDKGNADNPIIIKQPQIVPVSPEAEAVRKCQLSGRLLYRTGRYNHPAIYHKSRRHRTAHNLILSLERTQGAGIERMGRKRMDIKRRTVDNAGNKRNTRRCPEWRFSYRQIPYGKKLFR